jgi:hypothetical protein
VYRALGSSLRVPSEGLVNALEVSMNRPDAIAINKLYQSEY